MKMSSKTYNFSLLNVNKRWSGFGKVLEEEMKKYETDYACFVEVTAKPSQKQPMKGVVGEALYEIGVEDRVARRGGNPAKNGIVCVQGDRLEPSDMIITRMLEVDEKGRWLIMDFSGVVVCWAYIPPSEGVEVLEAFEAAVGRRAHGDTPIILAGDFNIRLRRFGDTIDDGNREKRRWMTEMVEEKGWNRMNPTRGHFTTAGRVDGGGGVTDLILANVFAEELLTNLVVHDGHDNTDVYSHSDHHLLTFQIRIPVAITKPPFQRIDIRRLATKTKQYNQTLLQTLLPVKQSLRVALAQCEAATYQHDAMTAADRQQIVDTAEEAVCLWMTSAAKQTAGIVRFRGGAITAPISEEHVERVRDIYEELHRTATQMSRNNIGTREARIQAWKEVKIAKSVFKRALLRSRKRLFDAANDLLAKNAPGDAKRLACAKRRSERTQSALDPAKLEEYSTHFQSTIGHPPTARAQLDEDLLRETDPHQRFIPRPIVEAMELMPIDDVEKLCQYTARGKATGSDDIFGEMAAFCSDTVAYALADLFWIIICLNCIPSRWRSAHVALVWKKKGSNVDIANYRPISLISRLRMIFEGGLRHHLEKIVEANVDYAQGGFRPNRSTLDQVATLHEVIAQHKGKLPVVYLDIKAAYDCVDRRLLWTQLANLDVDDTRERTRGLLIPLLRQLFDANSALFLVGGQKSEPLFVSRGLLQGTVLAPMLFTIYINDLPKRLRLHHPTIPLDHRTIQQGRESDKQSNSIFFADDAAIFATDTDNFQPMLETCNQWAADTGSTWAPLKCEAVGFPAGQSLQLAGAEIPKYDRKNYLGIIFSSKGVEMLESIEMRVKRAQNMLSFLKARGYNGGGFRYAASRRHYFTFIRSMAEYGIALKQLTAEERLPLEKLQHRALTTLFSTSPRTTPSSPRIILGISSIRTRNELLHAQFLQRIHCNKSDNNTAVITYRATINTRYPAGRNGRLSFFRPDHTGNQRFCEVQPEPPLPLAPPVINHRVHGSREERQQEKPTPPIFKGYRFKWYVEDLENELTAIRLAPRGPRTPLLLRYSECRIPHAVISSLIPRHVERPIVLWMLGVAISRDRCHKCNININNNRRQHAVECAGISDQVKALYDPVLEDDNNITMLGGTIIDIAIRDSRTWALSKDDRDIRNNSLDRLDKLATLIRTIIQNYTGKQYVPSASAADAHNETQSLMEDLPVHAYGRRFVRLRHALRQAIRHNFTPITANTLRPPPLEPAPDIEMPALPTEAEINDILYRPEYRGLAARLPR